MRSRKVPALWPISGVLSTKIYRVSDNGRTVTNIEDNPGVVDAIPTVSTFSMYPLRQLSDQTKFRCFQPTEKSDITTANQHQLDL